MLTIDQARARNNGRAPMPVVTVPRLCPGGTVVCLATGPSLTPDDVEYCRGKATAIAVNDAYRYAPWAAALIASDTGWWDVHKGVPSFLGLKYCLSRSAVGRWPDVLVLRNAGPDGLALDPTGLKTGHNSGAAAVNLAVHFGATRIVLLGYDLGLGPDGRAHFFGAHPKGLRNHSPYPLFRSAFRQMVGPLRAAGVEVVNCSRRTALDCFPRMPLAEALP